MARMTKKKKGGKFGRSINDQKMPKSRYKDKRGEGRGGEGIRKHLEFIRKQPRYGAAGKVGRMKIARTFKSASPCDLTSMGHFSFPSFLFLSVGCATPFSRPQPAALPLSLSPPFPFHAFSSFLRVESRHLS